MRVTERLSTFSTRTSAADDLNLMLGESAQLITVNVVRRDTLALRNRRRRMIDGHRPMPELVILSGRH